jgi:hypothetical protein
LDLKGDYEELKGQYTTNEQEHDRATKAIMLDMLEQQMALDGLSAAEVAVLEALAKKWGLYDQATADAMAATEAAATWLQSHPEDIANAERIMNGQTNLWLLNKQEAALAKGEVMGYLDALNAVDGKTVNTYINTFMQEFQGEHNRASGGPVYAGQSYIVGEAGPEPFIPSVDGMILPNSAMSNYSVSTNNARNISLNMGGVNITNGMDMNAFEARLTYTIKRAMQ